MKNIDDDTHVKEEFWKVTEAMIDLFHEKNKMYGKSNICSGTSEDDVSHSLLFLLCRIGDKYNRLKTMIMNKQYLENTDEAITDTLLDLANYCAIAKIVYDRKWL